MAEETKNCCCSQRRKVRERTEEEALLQRLSRIEGQVRGVRGMVENSAYCTDILTQVSAIQSALNAFNRELLARHIRTCVVTDIQKGDLEEFEMTTIKVPDMMCENCVKRITNALTAAELTFRVDLAAKNVTIDGCENCVKTAVSELEDLGFTPEVQG